MQFRNLDRVGYGPQIVGMQSGPQIVGQFMGPTPGVPVGHPSFPMTPSAPPSFPMLPPGHPGHSLGIPGHPFTRRFGGGGPWGGPGPWGGGPSFGGPYGGPWGGPGSFGGPFGGYGGGCGPRFNGQFNVLAGPHHIGYPPGAWPAMMPHAYSGFPHITNTPPTQVREFIIGFGPQLVDGLSTAIFQAQPQLIFRGSRLIIPSALANGFVVDDLRVGKDSQSVSANPIPAAAFSELAVGVALGLDTAVPGILISLTVTNTAATAATFSAALIGTSMQ